MEKRNGKIPGRRNRRHSYEQNKPVRKLLNFVMSLESLKQGLLHPASFVKILKFKGNCLIILLSSAKKLFTGVRYEKNYRYFSGFEINSD